MSDISEEEWKLELLKILEELDSQQYQKMKEYLPKIPSSQRSGRSRPNVTQKIIEHYGLEGSILVIDEAMVGIPRMDEVVQNLLRPFVNKLRNRPDKGNDGQKRKSSPGQQEEKSTAEKKRKPDPEEEGNSSAAGRLTDQLTNHSGLVHTADQQSSCRPDEETNTRHWKKSISDLTSSSELPDTDVIAGKVLQKFKLETCQTQDNVKTFRFYVVVADETASITLMVYGKQRHQQIMEGKSYLFRRLRRDKDVVMVTTQSKVSETSSVQVPEEVMMEARTCIYSESPLCSIAHAKLSANTTVSVGGSVTEIDPAEHVTVQPKQKKIKRQNFQIKDDTDSIRISMLGESTKQCKGLSVSDVVKVTNMNVNRSDETVSLDSTGSTRIHRVRSVDTQEARIEIVGIIKATRWETHLDAVFNQQLHTFVVAPRLLTKAFSLTLGSDFKQSVLDKMPLLADAVIRGNRIQKITAA